MGAGPQFPGLQKLPLRAAFRREAFCGSVLLFCAGVGCSEAPSCYGQQILKAQVRPP